MKLIKRLDIFILKNFLTLFAGTFCISLFVVMMQFLWKYIDDLVGKGLTMDIYAKFFFYAIESLVPEALPLAVLLASLISFGNIGERLELLAIKAAGISLIRTMRPLIILNVLFVLGAFHFQNKIVPEAQQNLKMMLFSMKTKSPELEIPEGAFYSGIQNINLYVKHKDKETGMLYDVVIYNLQDGVNRAHIILADSGKMETTSNKMHLLLHLYSGEQFENMQGGALQANNVPYRRETFVTKHFIIDFDMNFNMVDEDMVAGSAMTKNMRELAHDVDSMENRCDSIGMAYYQDMKGNSLNIPHKQRLSDYDSLSIIRMDAQTVKELKQEEEAYLAYKEKVATSVPKASVNIDSLFEQLNSQQKQRVIMSAVQKVGFQTIMSGSKASDMEWEDKQIRRHKVQYWEKITKSLACLIFFFIGASLGAIIRKGGLGFPVVVAVIIFIIYYTIGTFGRKVGQEGGMPVWMGMWLSTVVLAPLGAYLTIKSNNDSAVFNIDTYIGMWKKLLGIRPKRNITRKEVIIHDPDYVEMHATLGQLIKTSREYLGELPHSTILGYLRYIIRFWFSKREDMQAEGINLMMEYVVEVLSNSKDRQVLRLLNGYPVVETRNFRFYRRRRKDLRAIIKYSEQIRGYIAANILNQ
ncbi:MAG: LptF/LptG family permease [Bacteroidaceae bacterium]|nr:LptF/LptG family permease [Bacteroidaceae bacterium]